VSRLILVRHSLPDIRREVPAAEWHLSPEGVARAKALARTLDPGDATSVFTSPEPKALETAQALGAVWGLRVEAAPGLEEHLRPEAQWMSRDAFEQKVRDLFACPAERVFGAESADQARRRFTMALMRVVTRASGDLVVVSHGTVMTLFVAEVAGVEPFGFWKRQEMPFAVTLTLPELQLTGTTFLSAGAGTPPPPSSGR
jgi:broad specificity phosphatase PhoE